MYIHGKPAMTKWFVLNVLKLHHCWQATKKAACIQRGLCAHKKNRAQLMQFIEVIVLACGTAALLHLSVWHICPESLSCHKTIILRHHGVRLTIGIWCLCWCRSSDQYFFCSLLLLFPLQPSASLQVLYGSVLIKQAFELCQQHLLFYGIS